MGGIRFFPLSRRSVVRAMVGLPLLASALLLSGCEDPQIYGSVGVSTGYGGGYGGGYYGGYRGYGGWGSPRVHSSISIGGRIR